MSRLSIFLSLRYLFTKRRTGAINVISVIALIGVAFGTLGLLVSQSIFNGLELLYQDLYSQLDPALQIRLVEGKYASQNDERLLAIEQHPDVAIYSPFLDELAVVERAEVQIPGVIVRGVDQDKYTALADIEVLTKPDSTFRLKTDRLQYSAVIGIGIASHLTISPYGLSFVSIYTGRRGVSTGTIISRPDKAFDKQRLGVSGVFYAKQPEYDEGLIFVDLGFLQSTIGLQGKISGANLALKEGVDLSQAKGEMKEILGESFSVLDRQEQKSDLYKVLNVEKWMYFLLLSFILVIASFNIVGCLLMIILEKRKDIGVLLSMGMKPARIKDVFFMQGLLIVLLGIVLGVILSTLFYWLQTTYGLLHLGEGYLSEVYPMKVKLGDSLGAVLMVVCVGAVASWLPVRYVFRFVIGKPKS